jgi:hypothetical protein
MLPETRGPDPPMPPAANGEFAAPVAAVKYQPGLVVSLCSIATGLVGFGVPVVGMLASLAGIGLGIWGFRLGRAARYPRSIVCSVTGISISVLSFVFWPYVMLSSSYH